MSGSNGNGNGSKRWGSSPIDPTLIDPTGQLNAKPVMPGYEGSPYHGPITDLRNDDPMRKLPQHHYKVHIEVLDNNSQHNVKLL